MENIKDLNQEELSKKIQKEFTELAEFLEKVEEKTGYKIPFISNFAVTDKDGNTLGGGAVQSYPLDLAQLLLNDDDFKLILKAIELIRNLDKLAGDE